MSKVKDAWDYLKGKKRNIGVIAIWVLKGLTLTLPAETIPVEYQEWIRTGIDIFLLGGTFDAVRRSRYGKKVNSAIKQNL